MDMNVGDNVISSPLCCAAYKGESDNVRQLLLRGHCVNLPDNRGWTPLHWTVAQGHVECAKILLNEEQCNSNARTYDGMSAIYVACKYLTNSETVKLLIESGADYNLADNDGVTPLHVACRDLKYDIVKELLLGGACVQHKDYNGFTPLMESIDTFRVLKKPLERECHLRIVNLLLDHEAALSVADFDGRTPLILAVCRGWEEGVKVLLERGSDINAKTRDGATAISLAAQLGNLPLVQFLLQKGASTDIVCSSGTLPLHQALHNGHTIIALELLKKMNMNDLFTRDNDLLSFLALAIDSGSFESFKFVVDHKLISPYVDKTEVTESSLHSLFQHYKHQSSLSFLLAHYIDEPHTMPMVDCLLQTGEFSVNANCNTDIPPLCAVIGSVQSGTDKDVFIGNKEKCFYKLLEMGADIDYCSGISSKDFPTNFLIPDAVLAVTLPGKCIDLQQLLVPVLGLCLSCNWDELLEWILNFQVSCPAVVHTLLQFDPKIPVPLRNMWKASSSKCSSCQREYPNIENALVPKVPTLQSLSRTAVRRWLWEETHESAGAKQFLQELNIPEIIIDYIIPRK